MRAPRSRRVEGSAGPSSMARHAGVSTVVNDPPQRPPLSRPDWPRPRSSGDGDSPAQYPIGWIHRHRQQFPTGGAGSSAEACMPSPLIRSPECPADAGFVESSAATLPPRHDLHRPYQTRDSGYLRSAERAEWSPIAIQFASGKAPWKPRRASRAPATSCVAVLRTSNTGVDSRRTERVATPVAEQHAETARRRRPRSAWRRFERAEAHSLRSLASPGGHDASAVT